MNSQMSNEAKNKKQHIEQRFLHASWLYFGEVMIEFY